MSKSMEPNPPARKDEDFPKTNTVPDGWVMDDLTAAYNPTVMRGKESDMPVPNTGWQNCGVNGKTSRSDEELFTRRLDPSPAPGDEHGMLL
jgi:hypothetical protein